MSKAGKENCVLKKKWDDDAELDLEDGDVPAQGVSAISVFGSGKSSTRATKRSYILPVLEIPDMDKSPKEMWHCETKRKPLDRSIPVCGLYICRCPGPLCLGSFLRSLFAVLSNPLKATMLVNAFVKLPLFQKDRPQRG